MMLERIERPDSGAVTTLPGLPTQAE